MNNRHHYETLNPDAFWDRKFGKFTNTQLLYIIKLIESIENKSVRDITHLEYFKRKQNRGVKQSLGLARGCTTFKPINDAGEH